MPKKKLKHHIQDLSWPSRTLCGKAIDGQTGSPLNADGSVAGVRVGTDLSGTDCRTCISAWRKLTKN